MSIYLDIETDWNRRITVIGFFHEKTGLVQLWGKEVTKARLRRLLPAANNIFTYNGHCFDFYCINQQLGIDLRAKYESYDLRWVCQRHGLTGGLKGVERSIGIERKLPEMNGLEAIRLWNKFERGDEKALEKLLLYNEEDVMNLIDLRKHLESNSLLEIP